MMRSYKDNIDYCPQMVEAVCYIKEHQVGSYNELAGQANTAICPV